MNTEHTSIFLMANLGSEVSRIFSAKEKGNTNLLDGAISRSKDILSEIRVLPDMKTNKEIDILEDIINDMNNNQKYKIPGEQLQSYFLPFAKQIMLV